MLEQLENDTQVLHKTQEPLRYKVLLLNDNFTTQDFVIEVLQKIFHKNMEDSINLMLQVHHEGKAICGIYPYDIAEIKVMQVRKMAKDKQYPLRATLESV
ncbi:MAG: ATP-dependent Clp protease adaptor ClpS [Helicobacter sp.]|nr:ATP-dependent Clp protease adaptor ClpS [Helicobacter sp.]